MSGLVRTGQQAKEFLDSLEKHAQLYRVLHEPTVRKWRLEQCGLRDSLRALMLFRVRQQIPFVLSVLCEYEEGQISLKQASRAIEAIENFHFIFTAITSQRSSGGISFMYALHARQVRNAGTRQEKAQTIGQLLGKLRERRPDYQEFEADFRALAFSEGLTKRKALVQYVLRRMTQYYLQGVSVDWDGMSIEHLALQGRQREGNLTDEQVAEIGNLILVSADLLPGAIIVGHVQRPLARGQREKPAAACPPFTAPGSKSEAWCQAFRPEETTTQERERLG